MTATKSLSRSQLVAEVKRLKRKVADLEDAVTAARATVDRQQDEHQDCCIAKAGAK